MKTRFVFLLAIIILFFLLNYFPCIKLNFSNYLKSGYFSKKSNYVVFLYGKGLCGTCKAGNFINSIGKRSDVSFVVPPDYSIYDIENLRSSFGINGEICRGNEKARKFLEMISKCMKLQSWQSNIYVEISKNAIYKI